MQDVIFLLDVMDIHGFSVFFGSGAINTSAFLAFAVMDDSQYLILMPCSTRFATKMGFQSLVDYKPALAATQAQPSKLEETWEEELPPSFADEGESLE